MQPGLRVRLGSKLAAAALLVGCAAGSAPAPAPTAVGVGSYPPPLPADKPVTILFENYDLGPGPVADGSSRAGGRSSEPAAAHVACQRGVNVMTTSARGVHVEVQEA